MEAKSPFLVRGPLTGPRSANTEPLRHVIALPALWVEAEARVGKPQGRAPLTVAGLRPGVLAGSSPEPLPSCLASVSRISSPEGSSCTFPLLPAEGASAVSENLGCSRRSGRGCSWVGWSGVIWSRAGKVGGFVSPPERCMFWSPRAQEMGLWEKEKGWHFLGLRF